MKKTGIVFLLVLCLSLFLAACSETDPVTDTDSSVTQPYDPTPFIALLNPADGESQGQIVATLQNESHSDLTVGGIFTVTQGSSTVGTGQIASGEVKNHSSASLIFDISHLTLADGEYTFTTAYSWKNEAGTLSMRDISVSYTLSRASVDGPAENRDVTVTPIAQLTESEGDALAEYLFTYYIPNCFDIFESTAELSSATLWPSIYALNQGVDQDTSEQTLTRADAVAKAYRYYPGATFVPEDIRMFDKSTQTFRPAPPEVRPYTFLSYEIKGDTITVYYQEIPEDEDQTPGQYATTLKNSTESGYFSFVSTLRVGAVG